MPRTAYKALLFIHYPLDSYQQSDQRRAVQMKTAKYLFWKLAVRAVKFLFSGMVALISFAEILTKVKGGTKQ